MANTLNLGNGNWAVKKDSLLGYNSENGNYKPLPFDFTRASSATVVNKEGLIETVGSGEPRIDFLGNTKGALKLEPQSTNYQPYSNDFSVWSVSDVTLNLSYGLSPDGSNNSSLITEGTGSAQHRISILSPASSGIYTFSCFVKNKVGNHQAYIDMGAVTGFFNFDTKTMYSAAGTTNVESWSNDWYRISITSNSNATPVASYIGIGKNNTETFQGDGSSAIEFYGAQLEEGSYATSYIPTQGSAVTRLADVCTNGGNEQVINSTEGVLYLETSALSNDLSERRFGISDGTSSNVVRVGYTSISNRIIAVVYNGSNQAVMTYASPDITQNSKIAVKYKANDFALWVDGVKRSTDIGGSVFTANTLNSLDFNIGGGSHFYSQTKDVRVYNTTLTDSELAILTTI